MHEQKHEQDEGTAAEMQLIFAAAVDLVTNGQSVSSRSSCLSVWPLHACREWGGQRNGTSDGEGDEWIARTNGSAIKHLMHASSSHPSVPASHSGAGNTASHSLLS